MRLSSSPPVGRAGRKRLGRPLKLRVLETSDVHMNLLDYDYYQDKPTQDFGLARAATLIPRGAAEARNSLLMNNGDLLQGNPLGDLVAKIQPLRAGEVHPAYKVLNWLRYDAGNIGNHEFNYGLPFLGQALKTAAFPMSTPMWWTPGMKPAVFPALCAAQARIQGRGRPAADA